MILIDPRTGSSDLKSLIEARPSHPDVAEVMLDYGDAQLTFSGPNNTDLSVAIEIKKLDDVLDCIHSGRFAGHQLIGLQGYDIPILLIEGIWRMDWRSGVLEVPRGRGWNSHQIGSRGWMYRDLNRWLLVMELVAGMHVWITNDRQETVQTLIDLHELGKKPWMEHASLQVHDDSSLMKLKFNRQGGRDVLRLTEPSTKEYIAARLPGIGVERVKDVANYFPTVKAMINATEQEWKEALGMKGKKVLTPKKIVDEIEKEA